MILRRSSINQINHIEKNPNNKIYVSCLLNKVLFTKSNWYGIKDTNTINNTIIRKNHHHMVGVHCLCACKDWKIDALSPVTESSRIVLPALIYCKKRIYRGYNTVEIINVTNPYIIIPLTFNNIAQK